MHPTMPRHGRIRFLAFGLFPLVNVVAMALYGLEVSTVGSYAQGQTIPVLAALMALGLLQTAIAAVKRARDIGLPAKVGIPIFVVSVATGPLVFAWVAFLAFAAGKPGDTGLGPEPEPMDWQGWLKALVLLGLPWLLVLVLTRAWSMRWLTP